MNRCKKKAFTIIELVIVIVVMGVLAGILIPTFSSVITKANERSALSDAKNTLTTLLSDKVSKPIADNFVMIIWKGQAFYVYGYQHTHGVLMQSSENPYRGYSGIDALVEALNCEPGGDETSKSFCLVKKASTSTQSETPVNELYSTLTEKLGDNNISGVTVFEGRLLDTVAKPISDGATSSSVYFTDMKGRGGSIDKPATRIVALAAADCEILYDIHAGDTLIGRGEYCDYPEEVLNVPSVQSGYETNIEQIIALDPEVIIMPVMSQTVEQVQALNDAGIVVIVTDAQDISGIYTAIRLIGKITGHDNEAKKLIKNMRNTIEDITRKVPESTGETVYFEVTPLQYGLWAAGKNTFMDEIATMLNLTNVFSDLDGWKEVSQEQVIARNPDYIVTNTQYEGSGLMPVQEILGRPGWQNIKAIQNNTVFNVDTNEISRPGPRIVNSIQALYDLVYDQDTKKS